MKQKTVSAINRARRLRIRQQRWVKIAALFDKPLEQRTADERYTTNYGICAVGDALLLLRGLGKKGSGDVLRRDFGVRWQR